MELNWNAIGAVGEILGAIAVFVSLLYLAFQVRHNTVAQQSSTHHQFVTTQMTANQAISGSAEVCELIDRANKDFAGINSAELIRLTYVFYDHLNQWHFAFDSQQKGLLEPDAWRKNDKGYTYVAKTTPSFCEFWLMHRDLFFGLFKAHVDNIMADIGYKIADDGTANSGQSSSLAREKLTPTAED